MLNMLPQPWYLTNLLCRIVQRYIVYCLKQNVLLRYSFKYINDRAIAHFRVPFDQVKNLSYENEFYSKDHFYAKQTHFHLNGFVPGLVLKLRQRQLGYSPLSVLKPKQSRNRRQARENTRHQVAIGFGFASD